MENLKMNTPNLAEKNFHKLVDMFPNAVTEIISGYDENDRVIMERANDADVLQLEISIVLDFKSKEYREKHSYDNYDKYFSLDEL